MSGHNVNDSQVLSKEFEIYNRHVRKLVFLTASQRLFLFVHSHKLTDKNQNVQK